MVLKGSYLCYKSPSFTTKLFSYSITCNLPSITNVWLEFEIWTIAKLLQFDPLLIFVLNNFIPYMFRLYNIIYESYNTISLKIFLF